MKRTLTLLLAVAFLACTKTETPVATKATTAKSFTIAVIPQGSTHEFWKSIHAGALKAAGDLAAQGVKVTVIWKGPMREDDREIAGRLQRAGVDEIGRAHV